MTTLLGRGIFFSMSKQTDSPSQRNVWKAWIVIGTSFLVVLFLLLQRPLLKDIDIKVGLSSDPVLSSFLHITDPHYDLYYVEGSSPDTGCHRVVPGTNNTAGKFGHNKCDTPWITIQKTIRAIGATKPRAKTLDFIVLTGDLCRHATLDKEIPWIVSDIQKVHVLIRDLLKKTFPGVPIVYSIGNNDLYVHDSLPPGPNDNIDTFYEVWKEFIPQDQKQSYRILGSYYLDVGKTMRVISLNTIHLYQENDKVSSCSSSDAAGRMQLQWLKKVFKDAKAKNRKVLITGHVPPKKETYFDECLRRYVKLIAKYSSLISGQLFGHVNVDTFDLIMQGDKAVSVALTTISTIPLYNPGYRLYSLWSDGQLDSYDQYIAKYKHVDDLVFKLEYSSDKDYKLSSLSLPSYLNFHDRLSKDEKLQHLYNKYKFASAKNETK